MEREPTQPGNREIALRRLEREFAYIILKCGPNQPVNYRLILKDLSEESIDFLLELGLGNIQYSINRITGDFIQSGVLKPLKETHTFALGKKGVQVIDDYFEKK